MTTLKESKELFLKDCQKQLEDRIQKIKNPKDIPFKSTKIVLENRDSKNCIIQKLNPSLISMIQSIFVSRVNNLGMSDTTKALTSNFLSKIPENIRVIALYCDSYEIDSIDFDSDDLKVQFEYWTQLDDNKPLNRHYSLEYTLRDRTRESTVAEVESIDFNLEIPE